MQMLRHSLELAKMAGRYIDYLGRDLPYWRKITTTIAGVVVIFEVYISTPEKGGSS